jgi:hypothetical protein
MTALPSRREGPISFAGGTIGSSLASQHAGIFDVLLPDPPPARH